MCLCTFLDSWLFVLALARFYICLQISDHRFIQKALRGVVRARICLQSTFLAWVYLCMWACLFSKLQRATACFQPNTLEMVRSISNRTIHTLHLIKSPEGRRTACTHIISYTLKKYNSRTHQYVCRSLMVLLVYMCNQTKPFYGFNSSDTLHLSSNTLWFQMPS